jgi:hypothetical protein
LSALQTLDLSYNSDVTSLEPLKGLIALQHLLLFGDRLDSEVDRIRRYREQNRLPAILVR